MSFGHDRERLLVNQLRSEGWFALRAPASLGVADVVAMKAGENARLIECKATAAGPYSGFLPADRERLSAAAKEAGAEAWLYFHPKRKAAEWIHESQWPITHQK